MISLEDAQQQFVNGGAQKKLVSDFKSVTPFITTVSAPATPEMQTQLPTSKPEQGFLPAFWGKVEDIGEETGHIIAGAGSFVGHALADMTTAPVRFAEGGINAFEDFNTANDLQKQTDAMTSSLDRIFSQYKSGQLSKSQYLEALHDWDKDNSDLRKQLDEFNSKVSKDQKGMVKATIDTVGDVITVATLGIASPEVTAATRAADTALESNLVIKGVMSALSKLTSDETAWKELPASAQAALKNAMSKTITIVPKDATAQQITRGVVGRVAIQYPLTFNILSSTAQQLYQELDDDKYGQAVKTAAFNALLLLSGGVIGQGLKAAGKGLKSLSVAAGIRPGSILDELSSRVGTGDRSALGELAAKKISQGNEDDVKAMIVALDSNLKRAGGNPIQAINNIVDHLEQYVGWGSLKNMTHEELWDNMVNYWKHAEGLEKLKKAGRIKGVSPDDERAIVPGRFTTQDKNMIATAVTQPDAVGNATKEERLQAWEAFKQANPNIAAANNPNVDKQITHLIETVDDPETLHLEINKIPTQIGLNGVPAKYAKQMAKDGYVAIIPKSHNLPVTPFEETSGKLATNAAEGDYFLHAAQPVPVLQSVGAFLSWAGLSPEIAQQRVQDVFRGNFQEALSKLDFLGPAGLKVLGQNDEDTAKSILGRLYEYMKAPGGRLSAIPITDMRMLTTRDVERALNISGSQAKDIQQAIMQAYLDVPRSITGIGDKILDYNFKYNPLAKPYTRIQGAARFSWNPVFRQGRLPLKAEILAQLETGGKFPTVAGTNTFMKLFFPGKYKELDSIVKNEDFRKLVPGGLGGEAAGRYGTEMETGGITSVAKREQYPHNALLPAAGLIRSMASRVGMDAETFLKERPEDAENAIHSLLHYDPANGFLNSPMAKTLNVAFFPFRFNVKVTTYMARFLSKQNPVVQYAAVKGIMDAHQFLNSPQGMAWYSQNADAIGLFEYFSPLETISTISNVLGLKHDSVMQYGELGGLPFGWIPMMLDSVGLTHFGQAYVNPKTGVVAKDYVPTSMYGAVNAALQDLLGSLFTWPGYYIGVTSKGEITRRIASGVLPGSQNDFVSSTPTNLTPEEQQFAQVVQGLNGESATAPSGATAQVPSQQVNLPNMSEVKPKTKPVKQRAKKKKDYSPELTPEQSSLLGL